MFHMAIFFSGLEAKGNRLENVDLFGDRLKYTARVQRVKNITSVSNFES